MLDALSAVLARLARLRVTLIYAAALVVVAVVVGRQAPAVQQSLLQDVSTNLRNLGDGKIGTLIESAFVNESGPDMYLWLPGLVAVLALGELLWLSRGLAVAFVAGHIGATLIVATGIAAAVTVGWVSSSIADATDVGMSYGAVAVLGTFTAAIPQRWRAGWAGGWLAVAVGSAFISGWQFTNVGHAVALVIGMAVGSRLRTSPNWTIPRYALLVVAAAFSYLLIAYGDLTLTATAVLGVLGAALAHTVSVLVQTNSSAEASIQSESHASGGESNSSPGISHS